MLAIYDIKGDKLKIIEELNKGEEEACPLYPQHPVFMPGSERSLVFSA